MDGNFHCAGFFYLRVEWMDPHFDDIKSVLQNTVLCTYNYISDDDTSSHIPFLLCVYHSYGSGCTVEVLEAFEIHLNADCIRFRVSIYLQ